MDVGQKRVLCFSSAAGLPFKDIPVSSELLAQYIIELDRFFFRLAIVLGVLMITIGGFQWLIALGNAGKIGSAKETIEQAVIGLVLALTSYLLLTQIDTSFVQLQDLRLNKNLGQLNTDCGKFFTRDVCENPQLTSPLTCGWKCNGTAGVGSVCGGACIPLSSMAVNTTEHCDLTKADAVYYRQTYSRDPECCCSGTKCLYTYEDPNSSLFCNLCRNSQCNPNDTACKDSWVSSAVSKCLDIFGY